MPEIYCEDLTNAILFIIFVVHVIQWTTYYMAFKASQCIYTNLIVPLTLTFGTFINIWKSNYLQDITINRFHSTIQI